MFAQVNVQPPQHKQKTNNTPSCRGDCSLSLSFSSLAFLYSLFIPTSHFLSFNLSFFPSAPCKLDSGNITMLFSLFQSLWPNCLVFQDHCALFIGCSLKPRGARVFSSLLWDILEQRWDQEIDSSQQQEKQPQATGNYLLHSPQ